MSAASPLSRHDHRIAVCVGAQIKKRREQYSWSRRELAATLDVSQRAVQSWEMAERLPSVPRLYSLAAALGVTPAYFLP